MPAVELLGVTERTVSTVVRQSAQRRGHKPQIQTGRASTPGVGQNKNVVQTENPVESVGQLGLTVVLRDEPHRGAITGLLGDPQRRAQPTRFCRIGGPRPPR